jgi:hypothetical protein
MAALPLGLANCQYSNKLLAAFFWFKLLQTPLYCLKYIYGVVKILLLVLFELRAPIDTDVVVFIESTKLALLASCTAPGGRLLAVQGILHSFRLRPCTAASCYRYCHNISLSLSLLGDLVYCFTQA